MAKLIIHVDDDADIRAAVEMILKQTDYELKSYETVDDFTKSEDVANADLVLLDVMVEEIDAGLKAYDQYKSQYPDKPIILLTSLGDMVRPHFENKEKMVVIHEKPIEPEHLLASITHLLNE